MTVQDAAAVVSAGAAVVSAVAAVVALFPGNRSRPPSREKGSGAAVGRRRRRVGLVLLGVSVTTALVAAGLKVTGPAHIAPPVAPAKPAATPAATDRPSPTPSPMPSPVLEPVFSDKSQIVTFEKNSHIVGPGGKGTTYRYQEDLPGEVKAVSFVNKAGGGCGHTDRVFEKFQNKTVILEVTSDSGDYCTLVYNATYTVQTGVKCVKYCDGQ